MQSVKKNFSNYRIQCAKDAKAAELTAEENDKLMAEINSELNIAEKDTNIKRTVEKDSDDENDEDDTSELGADGKKSWNVRSRFNKGSAQRVKDNYDFVKNQIEKEEYMNGGYHGRAGTNFYYGQNEPVSSRYNTPVSRTKHNDRNFNTFTCSAFDWDCKYCNDRTRRERANCSDSQFCYEDRGVAKCADCTKWGATCSKCTLKDGCTDCG